MQRAEKISLHVTLEHIPIGGGRGLRFLKLELHWGRKGREGTYVFHFHFTTRSLKQNEWPLGAGT